MQEHFLPSKLHIKYHKALQHLGKNKYLGTEIFGIDDTKLYSSRFLSVLMIEPQSA
jgi:hypothetical protein